jgi:DNA-binding GntR family transcriptional regulator
MDLDHDSVVALYVQLADVLRGQIQSGEIRGRVPSPRSLSQQYGVSIGTARRALEILVKEGLVNAASGRGHFTA